MPPWKESVPISRRSSAFGTSCESPPSRLFNRSAVFANPS
jgi:hypothetical protein